MRIAVLFLFMTLGNMPEPLVVPATETFQQQDTLLRSRISATKDARLSSSSPLQSIDAAGIERMGAHEVSEVLRTFAGVSVKDYGGIGGLKTVSVRSLGAQHTAVVYDGVPVSDAQNGQIDISRFNLENVSSLNVTIGPSDDIFRSARTFNASGVLSIQSVVPEFKDKPMNVVAQMGVASFGTYIPYVQVQRKISDSVSASVNARWLSSDGEYPFTLVNGSQVTRERRLNSDVDNIQVGFDLFADVKGGRIHAKASYDDSERGLPGSVVLYTQNPTERLWERDFRSSVSFQSEWQNNWRLQVSGNYDRNSTRYLNTSALYPVPEDDRYVQQEWAGSGIIEYDTKSHFRFSLAEDAFVNALESRWRVVDKQANESLAVSRLSNISVLSAQYYSESLVATVSMSGTYMQEHSDGPVSAPVRSRFSPSVSLSWHVNDGLMFRLSAQDAFRVPTFNDLYYARIGNTALVPEKARQCNIGSIVSHSFGSVVTSMTADVYFGSVRDKIIAVPTMFIWKMRNVGRVNMSGVDVTVSAATELGRNVTARLNANYSYKNAVDVTDQSAKNYRHQIQYTARHGGNVLLSLESSLLSGSYTLTAVGKRYFLPQNIKANEIPPFCDHSICLYRDFKMNNTSFKLSVEALNLLDINYDVIRYYPMPGRNYRLTLKFIY